MFLLLAGLILSNKPSEFWREMADLFGGSFKTATSVLTLMMVLGMAAFYIKMTSLRISQGQLIFTAPQAKGCTLDINQITQASYSATPAKQKFIFAVGQLTYILPHRVIDPEGFVKSLQNFNPNIQVKVLA